MKKEKEETADSPVWRMKNRTLKKRIAVLKKLGTITGYILAEILECQSVLFWRGLDSKTKRLSIEAHGERAKFIAFDEYLFVGCS